MSNNNEKIKKDNNVAKEKHTNKSKPKKEKKHNINYKEENNKLKSKVIELEKKLIEKEIENTSNIIAFQNKAKGFQDKAQKEVNKIKHELYESLEAEKVNIQKFSIQKLVETIIEPLINFEIAIKAGKNNEAVKAYVMGFEMLLDQIYHDLASHGVTRIKPKVGQIFNPEIHYAITSHEGEKKNTIFEVKKPGFKLHERVIKPATVVIEK